MWPPLQSSPAIALPGVKAPAQLCTPAGATAGSPEDQNAGSRAPRLCFGAAASRAAWRCSGKLRKPKPGVWGWSPGRSGDRGMAPAPARPCTAVPMSTCRAGHAEGRAGACPFARCLQAAAPAAVAAAVVLARGASSSAEGAHPACPQCGDAMVGQVRAAWQGAACTGGNTDAPWQRDAGSACGLLPVVSAAALAHPPPPTRRRRPASGAAARPWPVPPHVLLVLRLQSAIASLPGRSVSSVLCCAVPCRVVCPCGARPCAVHEPNLRSGHCWLRPHTHTPPPSPSPSHPCPCCLAAASPPPPLLPTARTCSGQARRQGPRARRPPARQQRRAPLRRLRAPPPAAGGRGAPAAHGGARAPAEP